MAKFDFYKLKKILWLTIGITAVATSSIFTVTLSSINSNQYEYANNEQELNNSIGSQEDQSIEPKTSSDYISKDEYLKTTAFPFEGPTVATNGNLGINRDLKKLYFTTFDGVTRWAKTLSEIIPTIKNIDKQRVISSAFDTNSNNFFILTSDQIPTTSTVPYIKLNTFVPTNYLIVISNTGQYVTHIEESFVKKDFTVPQNSLINSRFQDARTFCKIKLSFNPIDKKTYVHIFPNGNFIDEFNGKWIPNLISDSSQNIIGTFMFDKLLSTLEFTDLTTPKRFSGSEVFNDIRLLSDFSFFWEDDKLSIISVKMFFNDINGQLSYFVDRDELSTKNGIFKNISSFGQYPVANDGNMNGIRWGYSSQKFDDPSIISFIIPRRLAANGVSNSAILNIKILPDHKMNVNNLTNSYDNIVEQRIDIINKNFIINPFDMTLLNNFNINTKQMSWIPALNKSGEILSPKLYRAPLPNNITNPDKIIISNTKDNTYNDIEFTITNQNSDKYTKFKSPDKYQNQTNVVSSEEFYFISFLDINKRFTELQWNLKTATQITSNMLSHIGNKNSKTALWKYNYIVMPFQNLTTATNIKIGLDDKTLESYITFNLVFRWQIEGISYSYSYNDFKISGFKVLTTMLNSDNVLVNENELLFESNIQSIFIDWTSKVSIERTLKQAMISVWREKLWKYLPQGISINNIFIDNFLYYPAEGAVILNNLSLNLYYDKLSNIATKTYNFIPEGKKLIISGIKRLTTEFNYGVFMSSTERPIGEIRNENDTVVWDATTWFAKSNSVDGVNQPAISETYPSSFAPGNESPLTNYDYINALLKNVPLLTTSDFYTARNRVNDDSEGSIVFEVAFKNINDQNGNYITEFPTDDSSYNKVKIIGFKKKVSWSLNVSKIKDLYSYAIPEDAELQYLIFNNITKENILSFLNDKKDILLKNSIPTIKFNNLELKLNKKLGQVELSNILLSNDENIDNIILTHFVFSDINIQPILKPSGIENKRPSDIVNEFQNSSSSSQTFDLLSQYYLGFDSLDLIKYDIYLNLGAIKADNNNGFFSLSFSINLKTNNNLKIVFQNTYKECLKGITQINEPNVFMDNSLENKNVENLALSWQKDPSLVNIYLKKNKELFFENLPELPTTFNIKPEDIIYNMQANAIILNNLTISKGYTVNDYISDLNLGSVAIISHQNESSNKQTSILKSFSYINSPLFSKIKTIEDLKENLSKPDTESQPIIKMMISVINPVESAIYKTEIISEDTNNGSIKIKFIPSSFYDDKNIIQNSNFPETIIEYFFVPNGQQTIVNNSITLPDSTKYAFEYTPDELIKIPGIYKNLPEGANPMIIIPANGYNNRTQTISTIFSIEKRFTPLGNIESSNSSRFNYNVDFLNAAIANPTQINRNEVEILDLPIKFIEFLNNKKTTSEELKKFISIKDGLPNTEISVKEGSVNYETNGIVSAIIQLKNYFRDDSSITFDEKSLSSGKLIRFSTAPFLLTSLTKEVSKNGIKTDENLDQLLAADLVINITEPIKTKIKEFIIKNKIELLNYYPGYKPEGSIGIYPGELELDNILIDEVAFPKDNDYKSVLVSITILNGIKFDGTIGPVSIKPFKIYGFKTPIPTIVPKEIVLEAPGKFAYEYTNEELLEVAMPKIKPLPPGSTGDIEIRNCDNVKGEINVLITLTTVYDSPGGNIVQRQTFEITFITQKKAIGNTTFLPIDKIDMFASEFINLLNSEGLDLKKYLIITNDVPLTEFRVVPNTAKTTSNGSVAVQIQMKNFFDNKGIDFITEWGKPINITFNVVPYLPTVVNPLVLEKGVNVSSGPLLEVLAINVINNPKEYIDELKEFIVSKQKESILENKIFLNDSGSKGYPGDIITPSNIIDIVVNSIPNEHRSISVEVTLDNAMLSNGFLGENKFASFIIKNFKDPGFPTSITTEVSTNGIGIEKNNPLYEFLAYDILNTPTNDNIIEINKFIIENQQKIFKNLPDILTADNVSIELKKSVLPEDNPNYHTSLSVIISLNHALLPSGLIGSNTFEPIVIYGFKVPLVTSIIKSVNLPDENKYAYDYTNSDLLNFSQGYNGLFINKPKEAVITSVVINNFNNVTGIIEASVSIDKIYGSNGIVTNTPKSFDTQFITKTVFDGKQTTISQKTKLIDLYPDEFIKILKNSNDEILKKYINIHNGVKNTLIQVDFRDKPPYTKDSNTVVVSIQIQNYFDIDGNFIKTWSEIPTILEFKTKKYNEIALTGTEFNLNGPLTNILAIDVINTPLKYHKQLKEFIINNKEKIFINYPGSSGYPGNFNVENISNLKISEVKDDYKSINLEITINNALDANGAFVATKIFSPITIKGFKQPLITTINPTVNLQDDLFADQYTEESLLNSVKVINKPDGSTITITDIATNNKDGVITANITIDKSYDSTGKVINQPLTQKVTFYCKKVAGVSKIKRNDIPINLYPNDLEKFLNNPDTINNKLFSYVDVINKVSNTEIKIKEGTVRKSGPYSYFATVQMKNFFIEESGDYLFDQANWSTGTELLFETRKFDETKITQIVETKGIAINGVLRRTTADKILADPPLYNDRMKNFILNNWKSILSNYPGLLFYKNLELISIDYGSTPDAIKVEIKLADAILKDGSQGPNNLTFEITEFGFNDDFLTKKSETLPPWAIYTITVAVLILLLWIFGIYKYLTKDTDLLKDDKDYDKFD